MAWLLLALSVACERAATVPPAHGADSWRVRGSTDGALPSPKANQARGLRLLWRFGTSSPVGAPPVATPEGGVVLAAREGYLHALGPDGQYRWSYTLLGAIAGAPAVGASGVVYAGTAAGRLFAVKPDGTGAWVFTLPFAVLSDVAIDASGRLYFGESDGRLYAVAPNAVAVWRKKLGGFVTAGPLVTPTGEILVGTSSAELLSVGRKRHTQRMPLPAVPEGFLAADQQGNAYVLAGDTLLSLDPGGAERFRLGQVTDAALSDGRVVALRLHDQVVWLDERGAPIESVAIRQGQALLMAPGPEKVVYVATDRDELLQVSPSGVVRSVSLPGRARYLSADTERGRVLVATSAELLAFATESR